MPGKARMIRLLGLLVAVGASAAPTTPVSAQTLPVVPVSVPIVVGSVPVTPPVVGIALPGVGQRGHVRRSVERTRERGHVVLK